MPLATPVWVTGLNASVTINGNVLSSVVRWRFPRGTNMVPFRNSSTNGDTAVAPGFRPVKVFTVYFDYDQANDPLEGAPVVIMEGSPVSNVELIKDKTTTPPKGYFIPSGYVQNIVDDVPLDGKIVQQVDIAINGGYSIIGTGSGGAGGSGL